MKRLLTIVSFALAAFANAGWGTARYCMPDANTFVVLKGAEQFVLVSKVAWELEQPSQKKTFSRWLQDSDLPKDLGELVQNAPPENKVPIVASIQLTGSNLIQVATPTGTPLEITVQQSAAPDAIGEKSFQSFAAQIGAKPSSLLVLLSGESGDGLSEGKAWKAIFRRLEGPQFFAYIGSKKGAIWGKARPLPATSAPPTNSPPSKASPKRSTTAKDQPLAIDPWLAFVAGLIASALVVWAAIRFFVLRNPAASKLLLGHESSAQDAYRVSAHERELVQKVRDELQKARRDPRNSDPEAAVVGKMMEAYDTHDKLAKERDMLAAVAKYKEEYQAFQAKFETALAEAATAKGTASHLQKQLQQEEAKISDLQRQLKSANNEYGELQKTLADTDQLLDQFEQWCQSATERTQEISRELAHE